MDFTQIRAFLVHEFFDVKYLGNTGRDWLIALCFFAIIAISMRIFRYFIIKRLKAIAAKTTNNVDDLVVEFIEEIKAPLYYYLALYVASRYLSLPALVDKVMWYLMIFFGVYYLVLALHKVIDYFTKHITELREDDDDSLVLVLGGLVKVIIAIIAFLLILSNFGVNIASLIAGLGIGGIAIAFALQKVLEDVFSSFSIYFDKPFQAGDFIQVGTDSGTVKKIGLKTTRIIDSKGEELIMSNSELTSSRIHNYKRMDRRRGLFTLSIEYNTPIAKLKKINGIIKEIISKKKDVVFDRVHLKQFGDSALIFEVVYFVESGEYVRFMDLQQEINFEIIERFQKEKIVFAYPTHSIHMKKG